MSVNIGDRQEVAWNNKIIETGIFKTPVNSPILLEHEQVATDVIVDRRVHGGVDKAVYAFGLNQYPFYRKHYPNLDWQNGMFGENLTFDYLEETEINVGDIYQLGNSKLQVSKPRQPCFKLGIRFKDQAVLKTMWESTKTGVYFRVIESGLVQVGDHLIHLKKDPVTLTIAAVFTEKRRLK